MKLRLTLIGKLTFSWALSILLWSVVVHLTREGPIFVNIVAWISMIGITFIYALAVLAWYDDDKDEKKIRKSISDITRIAPIFMFLVLFAVLRILLEQLFIWEKKEEEDVHD